MRKDWKYEVKRMVIKLFLLVLMVSVAFFSKHLVDLFPWEGIVIPLFLYIAILVWEIYFFFSIDRYVDWIAGDKVE